MCKQMCKSSWQAAAMLTPEVIPVSTNVQAHLKRIRRNPRGVRATPVCRMKSWTDTSTNCLPRLLEQ